MTSPHTASVETVGVGSGVGSGIGSGDGSAVGGTVIGKNGSADACCTAEL